MLSRRPLLAMLVAGLGVVVIAQRPLDRALAAAEQSLVSSANTALARALTEARAQAIADGVSPIPLDMRRRLEGFYPAALLDAVRYRVGWGKETPPLGAMLRLESVRAMTFGNVVVFASPEVAQNPRIWVHELAHVQQYQRWGVDGFAEHYLRDPQGVEDEAWEAFDRFDTWARAQGRIAATGYAVE